MKKMTVNIDAETHQKLSRIAITEHRSTKAQAEVFIIDSVNKRSDGLTDAEYLRLVDSTR